FCGSGVSVPAGLPNFKGLAKHVTEGLAADLSREERRECRKARYDRFLGLLAHDGRYGRRLVVEEVRKALTPPPHPGLQTHKALLDLATTRAGITRLITTNFDCLFEKARPTLRWASAPLLPVPKPQKWDSLVYLHGRLTDEDTEGRHLVLTAGDFGIAYLVERWASRFVAELFNHFDVLFIGYSAEDPPMRYLVDALAAEREGDRRIRNAYALVPVQRGREEAAAKDWRSRGIVPIPYDPDRRHAALHETLVAWAGIWRGGLRSRQNIVSEHGPKDPTHLGPEVTSQVCWALSEPDGIVARQFAEIQPPPPLTWLPIFEKEGLLSRAAAPGIKLPLVDPGRVTTAPSRLDQVTLALGAWLCGHLAAPELIRWVIESGRSLHPDWAAMIHQRLKGEHAPPAAFSKVWRILSGEGHRLIPDLEVFSICDRLSSEAWTAALRLDLVRALTPFLDLSQAWSRPQQLDGELSVRDLVSVECAVRAGDMLPTLVKRLAARPDGFDPLRNLAWELTELLRQAVDSLSIVDLANAEWDPSYIQHPSIAPHPQDIHGAGWTWLIEFVRRAFQALVQDDPDQARLLVQRWMAVPYPVFRRLVLFGATTAAVPGPSQALQFILEQPHLCLWSVTTQLELFKLLPVMWAAVDDPGRQRLAEAILQGPPRAMYRKDLTPTEWDEARDWAIWERLIRLQSASPPLGTEPAGRLGDLERQHPEWRLTGEEREGFPSWVESRVGLESDYSAEALLALGDEQLTELLVSQQEHRRGLLEQWRLGVSHDPPRGVKILRALDVRRAYAPDVWSKSIAGFSALSVEAPIARSVLELLAQLPRGLVDACLWPFADLVRSLSKSVPSSLRPAVLAVWDLALPSAAAHVPEKTDPERVDAAINHSIGILAEALFGVLRSRPLKRGDGLPDDVRERLERLLGIVGEPGRLARVIVGSRLVLLHELDANWTRLRVIPLFAWSDAAEAVGAWKGYLWSPSLTFGLWADLKLHFLDAFGHLPEIGNHTENLAGLLAAISIDGEAVITVAEARTCLRSLDDFGRGTVAHWIVERLEGAGEQAENLWRDRVGPWIAEAWPKEKLLRGPHSSLNLTRAAILSRAAFPEAEKLIAQFLVPLETGSSLALQALVQSGHLESHPHEALELLNTVTPDNPGPWFGPLGQCLSKIETARPELAAELGFQRLKEISIRSQLETQ
ncbi:MAG: SIR2 family protein, partial [Candidatus Methylomirabilales bacterium]